MARQKLLDLVLPSSVCLHEVVTSGAVDVNIHQSGSQNAISKICNTGTWRRFHIIGDFATYDYSARAHHHRRVNLSQRPAHTLAVKIDQRLKIHVLNKLSKQRTPV